MFKLNETCVKLCTFCFNLQQLGLNARGCGDSSTQVRETELKVIHFVRAQFSVFPCYLKSYKVTNISQFSSPSLLSYRTILPTGLPRRVL